MLFNLQKILAGAAPQGPLPEATPVSAVGLMGRDYHNVTFDLCVAQGDTVRAGQTLATDRHHPEICFVATAAGQVHQIKRGPRRSLDSLEITTQGSEEEVFDISPAQNDDAALRDLLLKSGVWSSFQTRPYGFLPEPASSPAAIFVTALDTRPMAVDPVAVLTPQLAVFERGLEALLRLTKGTVFLCQKPGAPLTAPHDRLKIAPFADLHPAGSAGPQIHALLPASQHRTLWQIGYQDVLAIGHLLTTGHVMTTRTIAVSGAESGTESGAGLPKPELVTAPLGAKLSDLLEAPPENATQTLLSGGILTGRETEFLGRYDLQVTVVNRDQRGLAARPFWHRLMDRLPQSQNGATLPLEAFERAFPFDILPVPLMRALAVGDVETAERLGCLELLEEDLALLTWLCPSGNDYGALLRHTLSTLAEERVE